jgi:hypothetical protein
MEWSSTSLDHACPRSVAYDYYVVDCHCRWKDLQLRLANDSINSSNGSGVSIVVPESLQTSDHPTVAALSGSYSFARCICINLTLEINTSIVDPPLFQTLDELIIVPPNELHTVEELRKIDMKSHSIKLPGYFKNLSIILCD